MKLELKVKITRGRFKNKVGRIIAICDNCEYLINFSDDETALTGYWIKRVDTIELG